MDKLWKKSEKLSGNMKKNTKVMVMALIGTIVEYYDFMVYLLLAPMFAKHLFESAGTFGGLLEVYGIGAIGYFFRPLGGVVFGHLGDKYGRKVTFLTTIILMTFATLLMAGIPVNGELAIIGPYMLVFCRILQGFAIGGEVPGAQSFIYEHSKDKRRIFKVALIVSGQKVGVMGAMLIVTILTFAFGADGMYNWGWRWPFVIGAVVGGIGLMLRTTISETPDFEELVKNKEVSIAPLRDMLKSYKMEFLIFFLIILFIGSLSVMFDSLIPIVLNKKLGVELSTAMFLGTVIVITEFIFSIIVPFLIQSYSTLKKVIIFLCLILMVVIFPSFYVLNSINNIYSSILIMVICGAAYGGLASCFSFVGVTLFPTKVRFTGLATSLNIAVALGGGLTPIITTLLLKNFQSIYAVPSYIALYSFLLMAVVSFLIFRNKQGKSYFE